MAVSVTPVSFVGRAGDQFLLLHTVKQFAEGRLLKCAPVCQIRHSRSFTTTQHGQDPPDRDLNAISAQLFFETRRNDMRGPRQKMRQIIVSEAFA